MRPIPNHLNITNLRTRNLNLTTRRISLNLCQLTLLNVTRTLSKVTRITSTIFRHTNLITRLLNAIPIKLHNDFDLLALNLRIRLPNGFILHPINGIINFTTPPILLKLRLFRTSELTLTMTLMTLQVQILMMPSNINIRILKPVIRHNTLNRRRRINLSNNMQNRRTFK